MGDTGDLLVGDYLGFQDLLEGDERAKLLQVRTFLEEKAAPVVAEHWMKGEFPHDLVPGLAELDICGIQREAAPGPTASRLLIGFLALELARCDPSLNSFIAVQAGLAMGSIELGGDDEQRQRWLPPLARLDLIGAFGLTEPHGSSDLARGLQTTCRRDGDEWVLDGAKRWIGGGTFADLTVIWARVEDAETVHGFVVERGTPGFETARMEGKIALRITQSADITLTGCRVPEANRLQCVDSFDVCADVLARTRSGAAWASVGTAIGAYEHALAYAKQREGFGRPIASFQLIQDLLVRMLGNITASLGMVVRVAQRQQEGDISDAQSSLAKAYCSARMRETVGWAREVLGGNGILIDHDVARYFADAEALYSYEGTREMNTLIVGRDITGESAFT